jgi:hypothetical protein
MLVEQAYILMNSFSDGLKACSFPIGGPGSESVTNVEGSPQMSALLEVSKQIRDCELEEDKKGKVTRFFGFAIFGVTRKWRKLAAQGDDGNGEDDCCLESEAYSFVSEMSIFHHEAINNQWYLESCYSATDQLRNRCYMTLVAPKYFNFGRTLMARISSAFNLQIMRQGGRDSIAVAFKEINNDVKLWNLFLSCSKMTTPNTTKKQIYKELLGKAFHARIGVVTDQFNEIFTSQYSTTGTVQSLRGGLMALTKKKSEEATSGAKRKLLAIQDEQHLAL